MLEASSLIAPVEPADALHAPCAPHPPRAYCLAVFNHKGGVGKTSLTFHLAGSWATAGRRVLVCDLDPQSTLTKAFVGQTRSRTYPQEQSMAGLFNLEAWPPPEPSIITHATKFDRLKLAPAGLRLGNFNFPCPATVSSGLQETIGIFLEESRPHYDLILLDLPPCMALLTWGSLIGADGVLVPVELSGPCVQGLDDVFELMAAIIGGPNPRLRLVGIVANKTQKNRQHRDYEARLRGHPLRGPLMARTTVPLAVAYSESMNEQKPISCYKPRSQHAQIVAALASELEQLAGIPALVSLPSSQRAAA